MRRMVVLALALSIVVLTAVTVFASGKTEEKPAAAAATEGARESPMLAEMVKAGKLPPLEDRIPPPGEVLVLEPLNEIGIFGGTMVRLNLAGNTSKPYRDISEGIMEFHRDGSGSLIPNIAKSWTVSDLMQPSSSLTIPTRDPWMWYRRRMSGCVQGTKVPC